MGRHFPGSHSRLRLHKNPTNIFNMNTARALVRTVTTTAARQAKTETHEGYNKIRSKMQYFQVDNGVPIHLRGGPFDNMLFISTAVLNGFGLFMCLRFFYDMSFPKKSD